ncbi:MAG: hypothetical protein HW390_925 [Candidatus Brocadiaceae bacterium]|nr:hypothetical protein [Candidatus Brocadiaceae bacterium]
MMCYKGDNAVFRATQCNSIQEIRDTFSAYIERWHKNDDRVIITVSFDEKVIKTEWAELKDYLNACEKDGATPDV